MKLALEYYMLAAAAYGGTWGRKGALLLELLTSTRAYGYLLEGGGGGGAGGALARFIPDKEVRL